MSDEVNDVGTEPLSRFQAQLDVRYGMRLDEMHQRFYGRVSNFFKFATIFGGSGVFAALYSGKGMSAAALGIVISMIGCIDLVIAPGERAAYFDACRRRFADLRIKGRTMPLPELCDRLAELQAEMPVGMIKAFSGPAFNAVMQENEQPNRVDTDLWSRFVSKLA